MHGVASLLGSPMHRSPRERIVLAELTSAWVTFLCADSHSGALIPLFLPAAAGGEKAEFNYASLFLIIAAGDLVKGARYDRGQPNKHYLCV